MIPDSRAYRLAWGMALLFHVLEYATRSKSAVLIPELEQAFARTSLGCLLFSIPMPTVVQLAGKGHAFWEKMTETIR